MKANEILIRQDRVVYILMVLVASLGLLWSFWQHQQPAAAAVPKATIAAPATNTLIVRPAR